MGGEVRRGGGREEGREPRSNRRMGNGGGVKHTASGLAGVRPLYETGNVGEGVGLEMPLKFRVSSVGGGTFREGPPGPRGQAVETQ